MSHEIRQEIEIFEKAGEASSGVLYEEEGDNEKDGKEQEKNEENEEKIRK